MQAAHDASKDARDVAGAEGAQDGDKVAGGTALLQGRRKFPAVVDEFSHEGEQRPGWVSGWVGAAPNMNAMRARNDGVRQGK